MLRCILPTTQVWTENGVVYGGIPNGLVSGESKFVIPKANPNLIVGPYQKGDDSKIFIYPIETLLVRLQTPLEGQRHQHAAVSLRRACPWRGVGASATDRPVCDLVTLTIQSPQQGSATHDFTLLFLPMTTTWSPAADGSCSAHQSSVRSVCPGASHPAGAVRQHQVHARDGQLPEGGRPLLHRLPAQVHWPAPEGVPPDLGAGRIIGGCSPPTCSTYLRPPTP